MKKITIVIFMLVFIIFFSTSVHAQESSEVKFEVIEKEETIQVIIKTSGSKEGVKGIQGTIQYDQDTLEYVDKKALADNWMVSGFNAETGIFLLELDDITDENTYIYEEKQVAEFDFRLKDKSLTGDTKIAISNITVSGANTLVTQEVVRKIEIKEGSIENVVEETSANKTESVVSYEERTSPNRIPQTGKKEMKGIIGISMAVSIFFYRKYKRYQEI